MFTLEDVFSKENQQEAFDYLLKKKNSCGNDQIRLFDLPEYWKLNQDRILQELYDQTYVPGVALAHEISKGYKKKRIIYTLNSIDRFILRMLYQKLKLSLHHSFCANNYAYQDDKGMIDAVEMAQQLGNKGYINVVKLDVKNFFDTISLERLICLIKNIIIDDRVVSLIQKYLYCDIMRDGKIIHCMKGLLQGSPISPILSNVYMNDFDQYLDKKRYHWIRYADDIFIFIENREEGMPIYEDVYAYIKNELRLDINKKKSGVFQIFNIRMLGYDFYKDKDEIRVIKHVYQQSKVYSDWYTSKLNMINGEYHLVDGGILTKKDYSLLFENSEQKLHIPVETIDTLCFYSNVSLSNDVLELMNRKNIKLNFLRHL